MSLQLHDWIYAVIYGLLQVMFIKSLYPKKYGFKTLGVVFLCACIWFCVGGFYQIGETTVGFVMAAIIVPMLIIVVALAIHNRKISASIFALGMFNQIFFIISDTFALAFSRLISSELIPEIFNLSLLVIGLAISFFLRYIKTIFKKLSKESDMHPHVSEEKLLIKDAKYVVFFTFTGLTGIMLFTLFFILLQLNFIKDKWLFLISLSLLVLFIFACILSILLFNKYIREKQNAILKKEELEHLMSYAATIEKTYGNMVMVRHDYKNMLLSLRYEGAKTEKLETLLSEASLNNNDRILEGLALVSNPPAKSLLASKLIHFANNRMQVSLNVFGGKLEQLYVDDFDAVRMLGILLDNAYEEALETELRQINIVIVIDENKVVLTISNSCRENLPDPRKFMKNGFSTKPGSRGIGLPSFLDIIDRYPFCSHRILSMDNNIFTIELVLSASYSL